MRGAWAFLSVCLLGLWVWGFCTSTMGCEHIKKPSHYWKEKKFLGNVCNYKTVSFQCDPKLTTLYHVHTLRLKLDPPFLWWRDYTELKKKKKQKNQPAKPKNQEELPRSPAQGKNNKFLTLRTETPTCICMIASVCKRVVFAWASNTNGYVQIITGISVNWNEKNHVTAQRIQKLQSWLKKPLQ